MFDPWPCSVGQGSGAAAGTLALIQHLAQEIPCAAGAAVKKKKEKKKKNELTIHSTTWMNHRGIVLSEIG